ncbi:MAG: hypothetical protein L3J33_03410 [Rhodobacteraceae bacterium]|nr:hypothetical protein [Paracoccaceae bacterium]
MTDLIDKAGNAVKPLTGEEIKALREGHEYRAAMSLISSKWRKAVIAFGAVLGVGALVWSVLIEPVLKKIGAG